MIKFIGRYILYFLRFCFGYTEYLRLPVLFNRAIIFNVKKKALINLTVASRIDIVTLDHIFSLQQYNLKRWKQFHQCMIHRKNDCKYILDLGANSGYSAVYFLEQVKDSFVIGLEPEYNNYLRAKKNVSSYKNALIFNYAIGGEDGQVNISNSGADNNAFQVMRSDSASQSLIKVSTINTIMRDHNLDDLFIVKVDIEGFESDLFSANLDWIEKTDIIIIELHDWLLPFQNNSQNFLRAISKHSRDLIVDGENLISFKTYG